MKNTIALLSIFLLLFSSCTEVIELELKDYEKKVVIDANIFLDNQEDSRIKIYYSAPFYSNKYEAITTAVVAISSQEDNENHLFSHQGNGSYTNASFAPSEGKNYLLTVTIGNETYTASSQFWEFTKEISSTITPNKGFTGNQYEVKFSYQDTEETEDFYLHQVNDEISLRNDQFTNGQTITEFFFLNKEEIDKSVTFSSTKISKNYYDYIYKLLESSANLGNPFAPPIGRINGNIKNTDPKKQAPLGYFHIAKRKQVQLNIQNEIQ